MELLKELLQEAQHLKQRMKQEGPRVIQHLPNHHFQLFAPGDPLFYSEFGPLLNEVQLRSVSTDVQDEELCICGETLKERQQSAKRIQGLFADQSLVRILDESDLAFLLRSDNGWKGRLRDDVLQLIVGRGSNTSLQA